MYNVKTTEGIDKRIRKEEWSNERNTTVVQRKDMGEKKGGKKEVGNAV